MEAPYRFRAHGLEFASAIDCEQAILPSIAPPDIRIRFGEIPERLKEHGTAPNRAAVGPSDVVVRAGCVADFWIAKGAEIVVVPTPGAPLADIVRLLLGAAVGAAFHQRGIVALHAGAVCRHGRAVLLLGRSGSGKSTVVATLVQRGFTMLDDNIAVIVERDGVFSVEPGVAELRLCDDAFAAGGYGAPVWYQRGPRKSRVFIPPHFQPTPVAIGAIYIITPCDVAAPAVRPLSRSAGFVAASRHVFCRHLRSAEQERRTFPLLTRLAGAVPVAELQRPIAPSDPGLVADAVEGDLHRLFPEDTP